MTNNSVTSSSLPVVTAKNITPSEFADLLQSIILFRCFDGLTRIELPLFDELDMVVDKNDRSFDGDMIDSPEMMFDFTATIYDGDTVLIEFGGTHDEWDTDGETFLADLLAYMIEHKAGW